jgi:methionine sulfoxide reductase catalytic subunit
LRPWTVEIGGLVKQPKTWDIDELVRRLSLEERLYRHRCVETWAMAVPWTGFPLSALIGLVEPQSGAKYVRMISLLKPEIMPGAERQPSSPWPYQEGLTMSEAGNELAFLATGIYGHELPKQLGGPIRLVVPWKYGFKSIKSIVRFEFTAEQPKTFWNTLIPEEYGFWANINPQVSHRRWSQENDRMIGTGETRATKLYNGYGEAVAKLYQGMENVFY